MNNGKNKQLDFTDDILGKLSSYWLQDFLNG